MGTNQSQSGRSSGADHRKEPKCVERVASSASNDRAQAYGLYNRSGILAIFDAMRSRLFPASDRPCHDHYGDSGCAVRGTCTTVAV